MDEQRIHENEDAWLRQILGGVGQLDPAWEALFAEINSWPYDWTPGAIAKAQKFRLEIGVGKEFTKKDLRDRGLDLDWMTFAELEKKQIIRLVRKQTIGAGGKGRTKNVYRRIV